MEILPRDYFLENLLKDFLMSLLVPRGWDWPLDIGETILECCLAFWLGLPDAGAELVEVVGLGKVLERIVNNKSMICEDNTKPAYRFEKELRESPMAF